MPRLVLDDDSHNAPDELNVWRQRPKGPKDGRDTQFWMVKSFTEHLHLDDAVESPALEIPHHAFLIIGIHVAVNDICSVTALTIQGTDVLRVVDGARDRNQLMLSASLAKLFEFFETAIDDVLVARFREGD